MRAGKMVNHAGAIDEPGVVQDAKIGRRDFDNSRLVVGGPVGRDYDGRRIEGLVIITVGVMVVGADGMSMTVPSGTAMNPDARDITAWSGARAQIWPSLATSDG
jgi:hypothetical protein